MLKLTKIQNEVYTTLKQGGLVDCKPATLKALKSKGLISSYKQAKVEFLGGFIIHYYSAELV